MRMKPSKMRAMSSFTQELPEKAACRFILNSDKGVTVTVTDLEENQHEIMTFGEGLFTRAFVLEDMQFLIIEPRSKGKMSLAFEMQELPKAEAQDFNDPPPPPESNNLLAQIREKVRREMGVTREAFLLQNDTGQPGYEIEDDDPEIFEEEIAELARREAAKKENTPAKADNSPEQAKPAEEIFSAENPEKG